MEIKIVDFMIFAKRRAERELTRLVNQGWRIVAAVAAVRSPATSSCCSGVTKRARAQSVR